VEMAPAFAQFEQANHAKATIVDINVDNKDLMGTYGSYAESGAIPETVFLKDGKVVSRRTGAMSATDLQGMLDKASQP